MCHIIRYSNRYILVFQKCDTRVTDTSSTAGTGTVPTIQYHTVPYSTIQYIRGYCMFYLNGNKGRRCNNQATLSSDGTVEPLVLFNAVI